MGFVMDGLEAEAYDRTYGDRVLVRRIVGYFRQVWGIMVLVAAVVVLGSLMDSALPIIISRGVDRAAQAKAGGMPYSQADFALTVGAILLAGALSWIFNFIRQFFTARAIGDVTLQLRCDAFAAVMARDLSFYDAYPSGKIVSRVTSDTEDFAQVVTLTLNLASQVLLLFIITGLLFTINVTLALLALIIAPIIVAVALGFRRIARQAIQRTQRAKANVNAMIQESVSGIAVAKNFRQEARMYGEFTAINQQAYNVNMRTGYIFGGLFPVLNIVAGLGTLIVVYFGGRFVLAGSVSPGAWFFFAQAIAIFWFPLTSIASFWSQFQQGLGASERVFALIDATPEIVQHDSRDIGRINGQIEFRDLTFRYTERQAVLDQFNLRIPAGQTLAIVGHTGAGKSTLGKLIARFYEFQSGQLLIDDSDIRDLDLHAYHQQLGIVPQLPFLFSGTIAENIRYARPAASDAEVLAAAHAVGIGDEVDGTHWLDALSEGLATDVGEEGRALSLGQRQLVALARLVLQDPAIVIMDEATASVDPLTEAEIQEGLDVVLQGRTAIVIAHRLSTVERADRIIVLDHGQILEEGTHTDLLHAGGHYAVLYNTYFRSQRVDYEPGEGFVPVKVATA